LTLSFTLGRLTLRLFQRRRLSYLPLSLTFLSLTLCFLCG
jgi:hypothetical protein